MQILTFRPPEPIVLRFTVNRGTAEDLHMPMTSFPIDLSKLEPLKLDAAISALTDEQKATLRHNIQLCRDTIVFFTALAGAKGLSGHTGGAYDTVPEVTIIRVRPRACFRFLRLDFSIAVARCSTRTTCASKPLALPVFAKRWRGRGGGISGQPCGTLAAPSGRAANPVRYCTGTML
jgi:hypothetical protein